MFTREVLKEIQGELPAYLKTHGHSIERGIKESKQKHLTVEEYTVNQREVQRMTEAVTELENHVIQVAQELQYEQEQLDIGLEIDKSQYLTLTKLQKRNKSMKVLVQVSKALISLLSVYKCLP